MEASQEPGEEASTRAENATSPRSPCWQPPLPAWIPCHRSSWLGYLLSVVCLFLRFSELGRQLLWLKVRKNRNSMVWAYLRKETAGQRARECPGQYFLPSLGLVTGTTQRLLQPNVQHFSVPGQVSSVTHLWKQNCFRTALGQSPFFPVGKKGDSHTHTKKREREREAIYLSTGGSHRFSKRENQRKEGRPELL